MIFELSAAYNGLKAAGDIIAGLDAARTEVAVSTAKLELMRHLMDVNAALSQAQQAQAAMAASERDLKDELSRLRDWSAEADTYELADIGGGKLVYRKKRGMEGVEPAHSLCANCFGSKEKSYLQPVSHAGYNSLDCQRCGASIVTRGDLPATTSRAGR